MIRGGIGVALLLLGLLPTGVDVACAAVAVAAATVADDVAAATIADDVAVSDEDDVGAIEDAVTDVVDATTAFVVEVERRCTTVLSNSKAELSKLLSSDLTLALFVCTLLTSNFIVMLRLKSKLILER